MFTFRQCNVADDKGALDVVKDNDLVMTVEMFEHMKNYQQLLSKVKGFLKPGGQLFVHIFTHKDYVSGSYPMKIWQEGYDMERRQYLTSSDLL